MRTISSIVGAFGFLAGAMAVDYEPTWAYAPNTIAVKKVGDCGAPPAKQRCAPENWKYIDETANELCTFNQQTPIDFKTKGPSAFKLLPISERKGAGDGKIKFSHTEVVGEIEPLSSTWQVNAVEGKAAIKVLGYEWTLAQFHFHNSEHTINSAYAPLEVHLVHTRIDSNGGTRLLVLGTHIWPGEENDVFKAFEKKGPETEEFNPYDILPEKKDYWHYTGSLTTPPCQKASDKVVQWFFFHKGIHASHDQIWFLTQYFQSITKKPSNPDGKAYNAQVNRPVQPLRKDTKVYKYTDKHVPGKL